VPGNHLSVCGCFLLGNDCGEEDNRYAFETPVGPDLRGQVAAVDLRHHDIEKDEVGLETARRLQSAVGVDAQKAACAKIETIMNEDVPAAIPYWYNYLSGNSKKFTGVYTCALGQMFISAASAV